MADRSKNLNQSEDRDKNSRPDTGRISDSETQQSEQITSDVSSLALMESGYSNGSLSDIPNIQCQTATQRPLNNASSSSKDTTPERDNVFQTGTIKDRETQSKTVDEIFAFINEGFHSNDVTSASKQPEMFQFRSWSPPISPKTSSSSITSQGFKSGNSVNFNRQNSLKDPNPDKVINEFLPEEKTVDLSLKTTSWKGRTPPAQLIEIDPFDKTSHDKEKGTEAQTKSSYETGFISMNEQPKLPRAGSLSWESGKHINKIQVNRGRSKERIGDLTERKTVNENNTVRSDVHQPKSVDLPPQKSRVNASKQKRKKIPLKVQIPESKKSQRTTETTEKKNSKSKDHVQTKPSATHRSSRSRHGDTVNAKKEFDIFGLVTKGNVSNSSVPSESRPPSAVQVSVGSQEPRLALATTSPGYVQPQQHPTQNQSYQSQPTASDENIKVYVNVNVNVNNDNKLPSNSSMFPLRPVPFDGTRPKQPLDKTYQKSSDFRQPMLMENDLSDLNAFTTLSDDEQLSSDRASVQSGRIVESPITMNEKQQLQPPSNIQSPSIDRFRMQYNLGLGGLSPIPSESYESDSTNIHTDSSVFSDDKKTPVNSDTSSTSSDSTIRRGPVDTDSDSPNEKNQPKRRQKPLKTESGKGKARKISFENKEWQDIYSIDEGRHYGMPEYDQRYERKARSYSHPEQYLLAKRKATIERLNMGEHLGLEKRLSDPVQDQQPGTSYDRRLPLNVQSDFTSYDNFRKRLGSDSTVSRYFSSTLSRQDMLRSSWLPRSPYSQRVSRSSSILSEGSRSGRRVRQLSMDIGEEWETIHPPPRDRTTSVGSVSSGFSYRSLRRNKRITADQLAKMDSLSFNNILIRGKLDDLHKQESSNVSVPDDVQVTEEIDSPIAEIGEEQHYGARPVIDSATPVVIEVTTDEEGSGEISPTKRINMDNPYNSINQRFHATLHCPCFLFFCFLCCAPAVYWMQRSDYEFDYASEKLAKKYGKRATVLFIIGIFVAIILIMLAITSTYFLLEMELLKRGHL